ncbi:aromatic ring-hydroxylating oxygenase subunit alpha [Streptomyces tubercidicus]|uniref:aromatic ring-hydroxylating oxygenase subunit alpha n=1 Tax=Streptomyces tubercidicus TaxID=47759 RepID=UPI002E0D37E6|nr:Rieske 2Fe-2S domain-containing protein [Streptomyces tubercidicus]WSK39382.1 Rieske 2Fe-2S domain-containing protein [Streptomyces tubercidicus]
MSFGVHGFVRAVDRRAFIDGDVLDVEYDRVFYPSWQFLGFAKEVSEPGDYILRTLGRDEVVVVRGEDGEVRALHNSCTHRGTRLCRASLGNTAHLRCSYHGWTFANDGRLVGVPALRSAYPPDFDRTEHGLPTARVVCRRGFLFATWDPNAPDLEDYLGDIAWYLDALLDCGAGEWEVCGPPQRVRTKGNWKIPTDNFAGDGYHMRTTHQIALDQGIYGDTLANGTRGRAGTDLVAVNIATPGGHSMRAGYVVESGSSLEDRDPSAPQFPGYPPERWAELAAAQTPEQVRFTSHCEVAHGVLFPNTVFLSVAHDRAVGEDTDPLTRYLVVRAHVPISARETECLYWTLVPTAMDEEWQRRSYRFQARTQSAGGILFEMDDFENFARIDAALARSAPGRGRPVDLTLGAGLGTEARDFPGPAQAEAATLSEHNQRAFYRRWSTLVGELP